VLDAAKLGEAEARHGIAVRGTARRLQSYAARGVVMALLSLALQCSAVARRGKAVRGIARQGETGPRWRVAGL